jgi:hypothetical protein
MGKWMRRAFLATAAMNMLGALTFAPPVTIIREIFGLPNNSHPFYLWIITIWIFAFGLCYLWLGITGRRERLFVVIAAIGKLSFVALLFGYALAGEIPLLTAFSGLGDLFFGIVFLQWLLKTRGGE